MRKFVATLISMLAVLGMNAQEPEYMFEIGAGFGECWSYNDINRSAFIHKPSVLSAFLLRYNANPRWSLVSEFSSMGISGDSRKLDNAFLNGQVKDFDNQLWQLSFRPEFHFWNFGWASDYRDKKHLVPFMTVGIGVGYTTGHGGNNQRGFTFDMPFGLGVKWKIRPRFNAQLTCLFTRTFGDVIDGTKDPYNMYSSCISNSDWVGALMLSITFDFKERCVQCLNKDY